MFSYEICEFFQWLSLILLVVTNSHLSKIHQITYINPFKNIMGKLSPFSFFSVSKQSSGGVLLKNVFLEISQIHRKTTVSFAKFLRTPFLQKNSSGCFFLFCYTIRLTTHFCLFRMTLLSTKELRKKRFVLKHMAQS